MDVHQSEQRLEQRGLAGAVRADDAHDFALMQGQRRAVEDIHARNVAGHQVDRVEQRFSVRLAHVDFGPRAGISRGFNLAHLLSPSSRTESSPKSMLAWAPR